MRVAVRRMSRCHGCRSFPMRKQRANADRHRNQHGDLAEGIEPPEVDENHVHHVTSVPERRSVVSEVRGEP